jgi:hypothetical protein
LTFAENSEKVVEKYLRDVIPKQDLALAQTHSSTMNFSTEFDHVRQIFKLMQENADFVNLVKNWEFHETSLSDIFLKLVGDGSTDKNLL